MGRPPGTGRRKIDIKRIEKKQSRLVTFSKRRYGLFSKAAQLCSSSGAQIAVIVFSPHDRPYAFGHPSVDAVIERFLGLQEDSKDVGAVKKVKQVQDLVEGEGNKWICLDIPIEKMGLDELEREEAFFEELRNRVAVRVDEMGTRRVATKDFFPLNPLLEEEDIRMDGAKKNYEEDIRMDGGRNSYEGDIRMVGAKNSYEKDIGMDRVRNSYEEDICMNGTRNSYKEDIHIERVKNSYGNDQGTKNKIVDKDSKLNFLFGIEEGSQFIPPP